MIVLDAEQGSLEWVGARLGIPTASQFHRIITPKGRLSLQRKPYLAELIAERALGEPMGSLERGALDGKATVTGWMERGKTLEDQARQYYELVTDTTVEKVGFVWPDESKSVGASPDALVGSDGLLEIKCPSAPRHLLNLASESAPRTYWMQVQGQLWVCKRRWCDLLSYCPGLPESLHRAEMDEEIQTALDEHIPVFVRELRETEDRLRDMGLKFAMED